DRRHHSYGAGLSPAATRFRLPPVRRRLCEPASLFTRVHGRHICANAVSRGRAHFIRLCALCVQRTHTGRADHYFPNGDHPESVGGLEYASRRFALSLAPAVGNSWSDTPIHSCASWLPLRTWSQFPSVHGA